MAANNILYTTGMHFSTGLLSDLKPADIISSISTTVSCKDLIKSSERSMTVEITANGIRSHFSMHSVIDVLVVIPFKRTDIKVICIAWLMVM